MRTILFSLLIIITATSCGSSAIRKNFSGTDSLVIHFKDEQAGIVTKTVQTTEGSAIRKVTGFIDASVTETFKCGYDGKMFFFKKGQQIQEVDFKMKDKTCNHFAFMMDGKLMSTKMNNEAIDFFSSLESGQLWY